MTPFLLGLWLLSAIFVLSPVSCADIDTEYDISGGWKGPKRDWVDYRNFTHEFKNLSSKYNNIPFDLLSNLDDHFGVWALLHNDKPSHWDVDACAFIAQAPKDVLYQNVHIRFFLGGLSFLQVFAGGNDPVRVIANCENQAYPPLFREVVVPFTESGAEGVTEFKLLLNTTYTSDFVLIDSISVNVETVLIEDPKCESDPCKEVLDTIDSTTNWDLPDESFYFENITDFLLVLNDSLTEDVNFDALYDVMGIWALHADSDLQELSFHLTNNDAEFYDSLEITAALYNESSLYIYDDLNDDVYVISSLDDVSAEEDGWQTYQFELNATNSVRVEAVLQSNFGFVLIDKLSARVGSCGFTSPPTPPTTASTTSATSGSTSPYGTSTVGETGTPPPTGTTTGGSTTTTVVTSTTLQTTTPDGASGLELSLVALTVLLLAGLRNHFTL